MSKKIHSKYEYVGSKKVFILEKNDLFILDALMHDGSQQKYSQKQQKLKYSEHGGLLDFDSHGLEKIIISTKKESDRNDPEIYFPIVSDDVEDYEFMYHTHPPTPTPGARAKSGIVYEIPSMTDIHTFILLFMEGKTQGSIIIAPEGIYVIRALKDKLHIKNYNFDQALYPSLNKKVFGFRLYLGLYEWGDYAGLPEEISRQKEKLAKKKPPVKGWH
jgi:hypothetical protein